MLDLKPIAVPNMSGRTILVTGAGRGIGAVSAGMMAAKGARVYAGVYRNSEPAWAANMEGVSVLPLDVTRQQDVDSAMLQIGEESGRLDGLVNNAGIISPIEHASTLSSEGLRRAFDVNALGVHRMTCAALPMLRASKGVVVNAGTGAATMSLEGWAAYCSSKAAARMLTQTFAMELKDSGVRFFFLGIPPTDTAMQAEIRASGLNPISRVKKSDLVAPEVPASAIAWLCGANTCRPEEVLLDVRCEPFTSLMEISK